MAKTCEFWQFPRTFVHFILIPLYSNSLVPLAEGLSGTEPLWTLNPSLSLLLQVATFPPPAVCRAGGSTCTEISHSCSHCGMNFPWSCPGALFPFAVNSSQPCPYCPTASVAPLMCTPLLLLSSPVNQTVQAASALHEPQFTLPSRCRDGVRPHSLTPMWCPLGLCFSLPGLWLKPYLVPCPTPACQAGAPKPIPDPLPSLMLP